MDRVIQELKIQGHQRELEEHQYKNKLKFCDVMVELNSLGEIKPSSLKHHSIYTYLASFFY